MTSRRSSVRWAVLLAAAVVVPNSGLAQRTLVLQWEIGGLDDPSEIYWEQIADAAVIEGALWVVDMRIPVVRRITLSGSEVRDVGREGQGPAEYIRPVSLSARGDTVVIQDLAQRRQSFLTGDGDHIRTSRAGQPEAIVLMWVKELRGGWSVGQIPAINRSGEEAPNQVVAWRGQRIDTLAAFRANHVRFRIKRDPPLHSSSVSAGPDGGALVMGDSIVIIVDGVQSRLNVVRREPDGSWATTDYPLPGQRRAMPERGRAFLEAEMVDWALDDSPRLDEIVIPDSVTAWAGVEVAPDGDLWLLKGGPYLEDGPSAQQWVKWSFDAGIVDTLTAPSGDEVLWFGSDYIVTRRKGDLDVESLRLYRLISTGQ